MATVSTICTRALRRIRVTDALETPAAEDTATALFALNDMMHEWRSMGVNIEHQDFTLASTFVFFVPPLALASSVLQPPTLAFQGNWNAFTNVPALATGTGTEGYFYRNTAAATLTLDDVLTWAVDDYAVFDGSVWLKSQSSAQFNNAVGAMLCIRLASEFGVSPDPVTVRDAKDGWRRIQAQYVRPDNAQFDSGIMRTPSEAGFFGTSYDGTE